MIWRTSPSTIHLPSDHLADLPDPDGLPDIVGGARAVADEIRRGRPILIYGDHDCDGLTGTAILVRAIRELGGEGVPFIPSRGPERGLRAQVAVERAQVAGARLVVTVDNGTASGHHIADLQGRGLEVVVTDHHTLADPLPACPVINPIRPGTDRGLAVLSGAGTAWYLAAAVGRVLGRKWRSVDVLPLVAIGTVGDVVSVLGANRALIRAGLARMGSDAGLAGLCQVAGLEGALRASDLAFKICPAINAPARLDQVELARDLLLGGDVQQALDVWGLNEQRRAIQATMMAEVDPADGPVQAQYGWRPGLCGPVAGRLAERYGRASCIALTDERGSGSARGPGVLAILEACRDLLTHYGGHSQAAGFGIDPVAVRAFRDRWVELVRPKGAVMVDEHVLAVEGELDLGRLDELAQDLERREPFGACHPEPVYWGRFRVDEQGLSRSGEHRWAKLRQGRAAVRAWHFGSKDRLPLHPTLACRISRSTWKGSEQVQLHIVAVADGETRIE